MPTADEPGLFIRAFDWLKARLWSDSEFGTLSYQDMQRLAADIGVGVSDLQAIGPAIASRDALLEKMMQARGLDPDTVRHAFAGVLREMEVTCARCRDAGVCQRALAAGTAAAYCHEFCGNAAALDSLSALKS
jgi:hypothetical protein